MTAPLAPAERPNTGILLAVGAYGIWGLLPLYMHMLVGVPALEVVANRVVWSAMLLIGLTMAMGRFVPIVKAARGRTLLFLIGSALAIATNWLAYIWAVQNAHVLEASLGYFINPMVNVALGVVLLGERVRRLQWAAVAIAAGGVLVMAISGGGAIWLSLVLALSFGAYGLLRKVVAIDALGGLLIETLILMPPALLLMLASESRGTGAFGHEMSLSILLLFAGPITTVPLLLFAGAARRMTYSALGLLQYIAPTLQFGVALILGEALHLSHLIAFVLIWAGCAIYAIDSLRGARQAAVMVPD
ncbi:EamA family transporter RarD [Sphingomonas naphthae]|uniref:EamA family transporter RarD n=1 Tax=Sphingomonas naphthae TaxID=1813468 RepID=A0ABY7TJE5_9SPHN|nr:EamA family transporter RarD [Sphingomonas naphthae]WCT73342.1 EamA family transporter RarD [Sphingomonas naphthae]